MTTSFAAAHRLPHSRTRRSSASGRPLLPPPPRRRQIRETWGLTRRQVAEAFGVTVETVRSWEAGRTSPKGRRRDAYATFLTGLDQARAAHPPLPAPAHTPVPTAPRPRSGGGVAVRPSPTPAPNRPAAVVLAPAPRPPVTAFPVRPHRTDPVSALRRRRVRAATLAVAVWALFLYVLHTTTHLT